MPEPGVPVLDDIMHDALAQAIEVVELDAVRAELWASDLLGLVDELESGRDSSAVNDSAELVMAWLDANDDPMATVVRWALVGVSSLVARPDPGETDPVWAPAVGYGQVTEAVILQSGRSISVALRGEHPDGVEHVTLVDLGPGVEGDEVIVDVRVAPADVLEALAEEDARIEASPIEVLAAATRINQALAATAQPPDSLAMVGRFLVARLATVLESVARIPPPVAVDELLEGPERDADDDAYVLSIARSALGLEEPATAGESANADEATLALAAQIAPRSLVDFTAAERDAVLILETVDWLGAIIGLVRAGVGSPVDGETMVDHINGCPEVSTSVAKRDRPRLVWAFDVFRYEWTDLGIIDSDGLTPAGVEGFRRALVLAWAPTGTVGDRSADC